MRKWFLSLVLMLVVTFACAPVGEPAPTLIITDDTTACWLPPTTNVDGSSITDGAGYYIYFSDVSGVYTDLQRYYVMGWANTCVQFVSILGMLNTHIYLVVTAADTSGNESAHSNEETRKFGNSGEVPNGPTNNTSQ